MEQRHTITVEVASPGAEIRVLRAAAGLRVMDLAAQCHVHPNTVASWEKGKRPVPEAMAARLRAVLGERVAISE